ncbi:MAG: manganese efflux pump [Planctomycetes bacterium]|nr:manganese efflux pump [Planctomycetota bacterium]
MSLIALVVLACGLAMDACAVAMIQGCAHPRFRPRDAVAMALAFGVFQGVMPIIGWVVGSLLKSSAAAWGGWIGCALLAGIGVKMIWEGIFHREPGARGAGADPFSGRALMVLALATSIDALAVGVSLPLFDVTLAWAVGMILSITIVLVWLSVYAGRRFGAFASDHMDIIGGLALIAIGIHLVWR